MFRDHTLLHAWWWWRRTCDYSNQWTNVISYALNTMDRWQMTITPSERASGVPYQNAAFSRLQMLVPRKLAKSPSPFVSSSTDAEIAKEPMVNKVYTTPWIIDEPVRSISVNQMGKQYFSQKKRYRSSCKKKLSICAYLSCSGWNFPPDACCFANTYYPAECFHLDHDTLIDTLIDIAKIREKRDKLLSHLKT